MNRLLLILTFISLNLSADQGLLPEQFTGVIYSPLHTYYAVATYHPTEGVFLIEKGQKLQIYQTESGKLVWETEYLGLPYNIDLADDGEHIIVVRNSNQKNWYGEDLSPEMIEEIETTPVLIFYKRDKVLKSYTVSELGMKASDVNNGWSRFAPFARDKTRFHFGQDVFSSRLQRNPLLVGNHIRLVFHNGKDAYFDIRSGERLKTIPKEIEKLYHHENTDSAPAPESKDPNSDNGKYKEDVSSDGEIDPFGFGTP